MNRFERSPRATLLGLVAVSLLMGVAAVEYVLERDLARPLRGTRHGERTEHVVRHRLERVFFLHQRHVLVRSRVEHDVRLPALEDLADVALVPGPVAFGQLATHGRRVLDADRRLGGEESRVREKLCHRDPSRDY